MKLDPKISEADFKDMVISIAKRYGWLVHHDLPAQNTRGRWMTNVQGDAGFPDLFMVHPFQGGRPLVIELKAEKGKTTPGQKIWLNACEMAGCHAAVWKPSDMEYILYTLSNRDRHRYKPKTNRTRNFNIRNFILECKIARGNCMDCGYEMSERTARAFDWDHRDPHTKSFELSNPPKGATMTELLDEMAKCDVVCRNCHALRPTSHLGRLIKTPQRQLSLGGMFDL